MGIGIYPYLCFLRNTSLVVNMAQGMNSIWSQVLSDIVIEVG